MPVVTAPGEAFAVYTVPGMPERVANILRLQGLAIEKRQIAFAQGVANILDELLNSLNKAAIEYAGLATETIIAHIEATHSANRPREGNMEAHIISVPRAFGTVDVAPFEELDKIRNPHGGYGPYWRAQEYGTGQEGVPSQEGRVLFGTFYESETPPEAAQAGRGVGHDIAFIPMGSAPGLGTIRVELPPRHFLTDGQAEVGRKYLAAMNRIQMRAAEQIRGLFDEVRRAGGATRYVGRISA